MLKYLVLVVKGMVMGLAMLIPGVSGGTMAVIMGVFDDMIEAVGSIFKQMKKSLLLLVPIAIGLGGGILLFSTPILYMLENLYVPTVFLFMGAILGGLPSLFAETGLRRGEGRGKQLLLVLAGAAVVAAIALLPKGMFSLDNDSYLVNFVVLVLAGVVSSVALVLPGISGSYTLMLLGLYESVMRAVNTLDIKLLIPMAIGIAAGVLLVAKLLQYLLKRYRQGTFAVIMGFVLASLVELFPGLPQSGGEWALSLALFLAGLLAIAFVSRLEKKSEAAPKEESAAPPQ